MTFDLVMTGVGGQGVLSMAAIVAAGAVAEGLQVKQAETHGMSQRGGAVAAHLRLADRPIASDLVAVGTASMILGMEPLESLRHLRYLAADGILISSSKPLRNIPDYPPLQSVLQAIRDLPHSILIDPEEIARQAGSTRSANVALVGIAARFLPIDPATFERCMEERFAHAREPVRAANLRAFRSARVLEV